MLVSDTKERDALVNVVCLTKEYATTVVYGNTTALYWQSRHLWFENRTDREVVLEIVLLNLSPEIGHMVKRDLICQVKEKLLLLSKFLFSIR